MFQVDNNISTWGRIKDSDIYHSFIKSPTAIVSSIILFNKSCFTFIFFILFISAPDTLSIQFLFLNNKKEGTDVTLHFSHNS